MRRNYSGSDHQITIEIHKISLFILLFLPSILSISLFIILFVISLNNYVLLHFESQRPTKEDSFCRWLLLIRISLFRFFERTPFVEGLALLIPEISPYVLLILFGFVRVCLNERKEFLDLL